MEVIIGAEKNSFNTIMDFYSICFNTYR